MEFPRNPFHPGAPSEPQDFVGREALIRDLGAAVFNTHRQALVSIVGQRRIGKTSLLRQLEAEWTAKGLAICNSLDCLDYASGPAERWLRSVLDAFAFSTLGTQAEGVDLWDELAACVAASENRVILMLDEFDAFAGHEAKGFDSAFFGRLRALLVSREAADKLTLIVATREALAEYSWAPQVVGSPFFNMIGKFLTLRFFTPGEAKALLARGSSFLTDSEIELLLRVAGPHPYFLHIAGSEAWYLKREAMDARSTGDDAGEGFEPRLRRRFREQAEMVYGQLLGEISDALRDDLYARTVLGKGDLRLEQELRRRLLLNEGGGLFSEGLRAFCVSRDAPLRQALARRFGQLPTTAQALLRDAATSGTAVSGTPGILLRELGWLGDDNKVSDELRAWSPFFAEE